MNKNEPKSCLFQNCKNARLISGSLLSLGILLAMAILALTGICFVLSEVLL